MHLPSVVTLCVAVFPTQTMRWAFAAWAPLPIVLAPTIVHQIHPAAPTAVESIALAAARGKHVLYRFPLNVSKS